MLLWSKCLKGEMQEGSGYTKIVKNNEIVLAATPAEVKKAGVGGAKNFFETSVGNPFLFLPNFVNFVMIVL